jgi:hypothetical protein
MKSQGQFAEMALLISVMIVVCLPLNFTYAQTYEYLPGDANMTMGIWQPQVIGSDVTYLVSYFRGLSGITPCMLNNMWASADVNGDCEIIGSDVTRLVSYFRGLSQLTYCPTHPPAWLSADDVPETEPAGWPNCGLLPNQPPVLIHISNQTIIWGDLLEFATSANDPDGTTPIMTAIDLPGNADYIDNGDGTGSFAWTPDYADIGTHVSTFIASDGSLADSQAVTITVQDTVTSGAIIADHTFCDAADSDWLQIPIAARTAIMSEFQMYYHHTSHGSQIITGCQEIYEREAFPNFNSNIVEVGNHVGEHGDTTWAPYFRTYLNAHPECNLASISWCWEHYYYTEAETQMYLDKMNELEQAYPGVVFVYQTGRRYSPEEDPTLNHRRHNNQIRQYCRDNGKVLFDFADIESYDPDGNYYNDDNDACNWCYDWCDDPEHGCDGDCSCAHSHCFNCWQKGRTWWVMLYRLHNRL